MGEWQASAVLSLPQHKVTIPKSTYRVFSCRSRVVSFFSLYIGLYKTKAIVLQNHCVAGIGFAAVQAFLREGAELVVAVDINQEKLNQLASHPR